MDPGELKKRLASRDFKGVYNTSTKLKSDVWEKFGVISCLTFLQVRVRRSVSIYTGSSRVQNVIVLLPENGSDAIFCCTLYSLLLLSKAVAFRCH